jgi:hypothetical protein
MVEETTTENQVQIEWVPLTQAGILKVKLPEQTVNFLTELTDLILADDPELEGLAFDDRLAGQIKLGKQREIPLTEETKKSKAMSTFLTFSSNICLEWMNGYKHYNPKARSFWGDTISVDIYEFWANEQREGDYNPLHNHCQPFAALSSIIYLKVPDQITNNPYPNSDDGRIKFLWSDRGSPHMLEFPGMLSLKPEVGDYYIFPAWLNHEVPPFRGEGERRSLSWNARLWV